MPDRFFCPNLDTGETARLEGSEVHHASRVLRKSVGDEIEVFNGCGRGAFAKISTISKKTVELEIVDSWESPPPEVEITLVSAIPKTDRFRFLIEKSVELGVDRFIPLISDRSVVKPNQGKQAKMEQVVIAACKQCGRNRLMTIEQPQPLRRLLEAIAGNDQTASDQIALLADPEGVPIAKLLPFSATLPKSVTLIIGPEGGLTEFELGLALGSGVANVGLGPNILRIETAAIALSAFVTFQRDRQTSKPWDD